MLTADRSTDWGGPAVAEAGSFLTALEPGDAAALLERGASVSFVRGQVLVHERELPERVLLLTSGRVKVVAMIAGREILLAFRGPGDLVAELSALDAAPHTAQIVALESVTARSFSIATFRSFLMTHPSTPLVLLSMLSRRLREADAQRIELSALTTIQRVAGRLLDLSARFGRKEECGSIRIMLPLSQEELASAAGASLESVGRALQTMRTLKCVETRRREIRILDVEALADLRGAAF